MPWNIVAIQKPVQELVANPQIYNEPITEVHGQIHFSKCIKNTSQGWLLGEFDHVKIFQNTESFRLSFNLCPF